MLILGFGSCTETSPSHWGKSGLAVGSSAGDQVSDGSSILMCEEVHTLSVGQTRVAYSES